MIRHRAGVSCLAFAPDDQRLASGDSVKEVVIWDTVSREPLVTRLVYHSAKVIFQANQSINALRRIQNKEKREREECFCFCMNPGAYLGMVALWRSSGEWVTG